MTQAVPVLTDMRKHKIKPNASIYNVLPCTS
jgi:hypothetical protein